MRILLKILCFGALLAAQVTPPPFGPPPRVEEDHKLPNGKSQNEEILKAEYKRSLEDAAELVKLSQSLQQELEANDRHVLSVSSIKKVDEIDKIAKRIRGRLRRF